ncbi:pentatricopeptide repeat domain-containing protein [Colletotrichum karsti]|uniref:Pentatricopeptide repeat domain-containing protein n=1 Tax=Colletotrichum karsti TaxID=1095194 RepID=A0A9P6I7F2_9PEZI|nr:pentatricopeptide repeat domain-containing protein [Colletotrichum karsti]KAF9877609.1 pentatricopeptide repeat domain-containing protein [Colletotrichum karsti]
MTPIFDIPIQLDPATRSSKRQYSASDHTLDADDIPTPNPPNPPNRSIGLTWGCRCSRHAVGMQALWSRAGQAHHCGCKACFKAAGGMIRQSATRVTPRKPTFSEIFTACYTGIMASAAVIDANVKDRRRLALEQELEQAKLELEMLRKKHPPRKLDVDEPPPASTENRYKGALWDHVAQSSEIAKYLDSLRDVHGKAKPLRRSVQVRAWLDECGFGVSKEDLEKLEDFDYAALDARLLEEEMRPYPRQIHRLPKTLAQLEAAENNTVLMVNNLLTHSQRIWREPLWRPIRDMVTDLRRQNLPRFERRTDVEGMLENSKRLNASLRAIFANDTYNRREKVMKVIHNLLVSPAPTTIHTYNLLILALDRLGLFVLSQGVVGPLLYGRREPTRSTLLCLLNHFKEDGNDKQFFELIQRFTGKDPRGIVGRRKDFDDLEERDSLFMWAVLKNVAVSDNCVTERAWLDLDIFTAIIQGLLKFGWVRHATAVFAVGLKHGIDFSMHTISQLIMHITHTLDATAARQMLLAIKMKPGVLQAKAKTKQAENRKHLARSIQILIGICHHPENLDSVAPWLHVPTSALLSKEQHLGIHMTSLLHEISKSAAKMKKLKTEFKEIHDVLKVRQRRARRNETRTAKFEIEPESIRETQQAPAAQEEQAHQLQPKPYLTSAQFKEALMQDAAEETARPKTPEHTWLQTSPNLNRTQYRFMARLRSKRLAVAEAALYEMDSQRQLGPSAEITSC